MHVVWLSPLLSMQARAMPSRWICPADRCSLSMDSAGDAKAVTRAVSKTDKIALSQETDENRAA
jgi:hypothetical protein